MSFLGSFMTFLSDFLDPFFGASAAAAAIVVCTLAVRLALHPLARAAVRGERVRARLAPRMAELQGRHGRDPERLRRELGRAAGAGGCFAGGGLSADGAPASGVLRDVPPLHQGRGAVGAHVAGCAAGRELVRGSGCGRCLRRVRGWCMGPCSCWSVRWRRGRTCVRAGSRRRRPGWRRSVRRRGSGVAGSRPVPVLRCRVRRRPLHAAAVVRDAGHRRGRAAGGCLVRGHEHDVDGVGACGAGCGTPGGRRIAAAVHYLNTGLWTELPLGGSAVPFQTTRAAGCLRSSRDQGSGTMKLLRVGPVGEERPALLDESGVLRDLSGVVPDIDGALLADEAALGRVRDAAGAAGRLPALDPDGTAGRAAARPGSARSSASGSTTTTTPGRRAPRSPRSRSSS